MITKYYVSHSIFSKVSPDIQVREIIRETEKGVWVLDKWRGEHREAKESAYGKYFDTESKAVAYIRKVLKFQVEAEKSQLKRSKKTLSLFESHHKSEDTDG